MKEAYITQLTEVEKALEENNGAFSDAIIERLSALVTEMKGMRISAEEYLKVMQLFFRKYEKEHNREGQHYCAIRMLQLQRYLKSSSSKHQKYELIIDREIPQTYEAYIYDKSRFYRETFRMLQQRLLLMTVVLFIALFILLSLLLNQTNSVAFIEALFVALVSFLYSYIRMPKLYLRSQLEAAGKNVENVLLEFDFPIVSNQ